MKFSFPVLMLALACAPVQAQSTDRDRADLQAYIRSVALPTAARLCGPVLHDDAGLPAAADAWLRVNQDAIARGRAFAEQHPPAKAASLDAYHQARLQTYEDRLNHGSDADKAELCASFADPVGRSAGLE